MSNYQLTSLTKTIGARTLYEISKLTVAPHDRIGLVGHNGAGKTTLFNQLLTEEAIQPAARLWLVPQLKPTAELSGGEQVRQYLNQAFAQNPDILLLDEPTANLDVASIEWLEKRLKRYRGALIVISHDRDFLDHMTTTIWELSDETIHVYSGNYHDYETQKAQQTQQQADQYHQYVAEEKRLKQTIEKQRQRAERATRVPKSKKGTSEIHGMTPYFEKMSKKLHQVAKSTESRLDQMDVVSRPKFEKPIKMAIPNATQLKGNTVLSVSHLTLTRGERTLLSDVSLKVKAGDHLAITGPNMAGKTSLLTHLLDTEDPAVKWSPLAKLGYFQQNLANLTGEASILANVTATSVQSDETVRLILARLGFAANTWQKPVDVLSGGERVRVSLAKLMLSDVNGLILDEPTNFLDIESINALSQMLRDYEGTLILVSHDRWFVRQVVDKSLQIVDKTLRNPAVQVKQPTKRDPAELLQLELKQTALINRLATNSTPELEAEYQAITKQIRELKA